MYSNVLYCVYHIVVDAGKGISRGSATGTVSRNVGLVRPTASHHFMPSIPVFTCV